MRKQVTNKALMEDSAFSTQNAFLGDWIAAHPTKDLKSGAELIAKGKRISKSIITLTTAKRIHSSSAHTTFFPQSIDYLLQVYVLRVRPKIHLGFRCLQFLTT